MLVSPNHFKHISKYLKCTGIPYNITLSDVQTAIDDNMREEHEDDDDDVKLGERSGKAKFKF